MKNGLGCIAVLLCLSIAAAGQAEGVQSKYCHVSDIAAEASAGWKQTYSVKGSEIAIDVAITVPEVDSFPVYVTELQPIEVKSPKKFDYASGGAGELTIESNNGKLYKNDAHTYMEDGCAENCSTPADQVLPILSKLLDHHGLSAISSAGQVALSRAYANKPIDSHGQTIGVTDAKKEYADIDFSKPLSKAGHYFIIAHQLLNGIPIFDSDYYVSWVENARVLPYVRIQAYIYDEQNYSFDVSGWMKIVDTYEEDIPLLPFSEIKATLEYYISAGMLSEIYRMSLGVVPYYSSDTHSDDSYVMLPVWEIYGDFLAEESDYTNSWSGKQYYKENVAGEVLRINAQTGEVLDRYEMNDDKRSLAPNILTWEQVNE